MFNTIPTILALASVALGEQKLNKIGLGPGAEEATKQNSSKTNNALNKDRNPLISAMSKATEAA